MNEYINVFIARYGEVFKCKVVSSHKEVAKLDADYVCSLDDSDIDIYDSAEGYLAVVGE